MNKNFKKYYLAILFAVVLVLLPTHPAKAISPAGWLANWTFEHTFGYALFLIMSIAGNMIGAMATLLNWAIHIPVYPDGGIAVINKSWEIMRDFANMFFIVALIMMAFATIFDVLPGAAKYNARALFGRFLFTALLINFSLVLGVMVIQGTQVLSNTFLTAIGDMANRLGQDLNPSHLLPSESAVTSAVSLDAAVFGTLSTLIFSIVLIFTYLFSILTALIFTFIRIPILWALLIVSPIAWILNIFPAGQGTFQKWWHTFIGWNMFLPIYLFFLYFGLYFLSDQKNIIQSIASEVSEAKIGESLPFSLQLVFFYIMTAIFMIGGTMVAMKASMFSGTGVVEIAKWSRGVAARRLGLTQAGTAAKQRWEQVQQEGLPGRFGKLYGGQYGQDQETGVWARRFGVRGAEIKNQKAFVDRAGKDYQDFERQYQNGQIDETEILKRARQYDATDPRGFAYRKLAAKIGQLDNPLFVSTLEQLSKNPLAAEDFAKTAKDSKFSKMKGPDLARMAAAEEGTDPITRIPYNYTSLRNSVAARREMFRYVQTDGKAAGGLSDEQFKAGLGLFGGHTTADGKTYLESMGKVRPDYLVDNTLNTPDLLSTVNEGRARDGKPPIIEANKSELYDGYLKDVKDISNIPVAVWRKQEFKDALQRKLSFGSPKAQRNFRNRILDNLRTATSGEEKKNILNTLQGARDTGQEQGDDNIGEDDLDLDNEQGGGAPPAGGGGNRATLPPAGPGPAAPPTQPTGRGTGNYPRGRAGFGPPTPTPSSNQPNQPGNINPNNIVNLRGQNGVSETRPPQTPPQNPIEYLKANLELFDRSSQLKTAEESLGQGSITQQEYDNIKKEYEDIQNKVSDLDLKGGLPNSVKRLTTRQSFESKLKELQP